ncbi:MAG: hypothetical protein LUG89_01400 [Methanosphaera sp.]|nr:hypothetical protein [Methanosphaera sp.]
MTNKKVEILEINDIKQLSNQYFTRETNHYLKCVLFQLRLVFRHNKENLDQLIELYDYLESILNNEFIVDTEELQILIYHLTDIILNLDDINIHGGLLLTEATTSLIKALYKEYEDILLHEKISYDSEEWTQCLQRQIQERNSEFNVLTEALQKDDIDEIKEDIKELLKNNYQLEYQSYKARRNLE